LYCIWYKYILTQVYSNTCTTLGGRRRERGRVVPYSSIRGATKGGWRVFKHPQPKKVCPVIRPDPMTFLVGWWVLALALLWTLTSVISKQPYQTHPYQTTSEPVFLYSHTVNDRWGAFGRDPTNERCRHTCKLRIIRQITVITDLRLLTRRDRRPGVYDIKLTAYSRTRERIKQRRRHYH